MNENMNVFVELAREAIEKMGEFELVAFLNNYSVNDSIYTSRIIGEVNKADDFDEDAQFFYEKNGLTHSFYWDELDSVVSDNALASIIESGEESGNGDIDSLIQGYRQLQKLEAEADELHFATISTLGDDEFIDLFDSFVAACSDAHCSWNYKNRFEKQGESIEVVGITKDCLDFDVMGLEEGDPIDWTCFQDCYSFITFGNN